MDVNFGDFQLGLLEHGLDKADIDPVLQHERGAGMAEQEAGSAFAQVGPSFPPVNAEGGSLSSANPIQGDPL
jgi:hypothetical protein